METIIFDNLLRLIYGRRRNSGYIPQKLLPRTERDVRPLNNNHLRLCLGRTPNDPSALSIVILSGILLYSKDYGLNHYSTTSVDYIIIKIGKCGIIGPGGTIG